MVELNKKKARMDVKSCKSDEPTLFVIRYPKWKFQFLGCTQKHDIQRGIERMWLKKEIISPEQQPPHNHAMTCQMHEYISIFILRRQAKEAKPIAPYSCHKKGNLCGRLSYTKNVTGSETEWSWEDRVISIPLTLKIHLHSCTEPQTYVVHSTLFKM